MSVIEVLERQELLQKLINAGHGELVEAMLLNEHSVFTRSGRINKSGTCRVLGWKIKRLEDALRQCREILQDDLSLD